MQIFIRLVPGLTGHDIIRKRFCFLPPMLGADSIIFKSISAIKKQPCLQELIHPDQTILNQNFNLDPTKTSFSTKLRLDFGFGNQHLWRGSLSGFLSLQYLLFHFTPPIACFWVLQVQEGWEGKEQRTFYLIGPACGVLLALGSASII